MIRRWLKHTRLYRRLLRNKLYEQSRAWDQGYIAAIEDFGTDHTKETPNPYFDAFRALERGEDS